MYPLRVENGRVLVPFGEYCPFGCRYCYAHASPLQQTPLDPAAVVEAVAALPPESFDILQLGYDGDPLANRPRLMLLLNELWAFGKHINISTKGILTGDLVRFIDRLTANDRGRLSVFVSFSCWESAPVIEPRTPSPQKRTVTIKGFATLGIATFVALRPILPEVADAELAVVVTRAAAAGATAVIAGPLYVDEARQFISTGVDERSLGPLVDVPWSPVPVRWHRYEDHNRLTLLREIAETAGIPVYTSSVTAIRDALSSSYATRERVA